MERYGDCRYKHEDPTPEEIQKARDAKNAKGSRDPKDRSPRNRTGPLTVPHARGRLFERVGPVP